MKITKRLRSVVCLCLIAAMMLGLDANPASAAGKKEKNAEATAAYRKFLVSDEARDMLMVSDDLSDLIFAMMDINHDGVKEMMVSGEGEELYRANIYAYIDGEVKQIDEKFSGNYVWYKNKNLVYADSIHTGNWLFEYKTFKNGKMVVLAKKDGWDFIDSAGNYGVNYKYYIRDKEVTKRKYVIYVKSLKRNAKKAKITLHANTAENRRKYVK